MIKRGLLTALLLTMFSHVSHAVTYSSGSTGADGAFSPTVSTVVALPPSGVLNYTSVTIPYGVIVTFTPNAANTPVYILASGNVAISGTVNVNGGNATNYSPGAGGPGGFAGGNSGFGTSAGSRGLGPGGGNGYTSNGCTGGGYATIGSPGVGAPGAVYGNSNLLPLIGGSGGGGGGAYSAGGISYGGGGGGAILIASSGNITLNGTGSITANGGVGVGYGAPGSGGAIKLMANTITGESLLYAKGGNPTYGSGYIRLEAYSVNRATVTSPQYTAGQPGSIFLTLPPTLSITSVGGISVPSAPAGKLNLPDITLPYGTANPISIGIAATNIPLSTTIKVRVIPQYGADSSSDTTLSGTQDSSTGSVSMNISSTLPSLIVAEVTFTVTAMFHQGEEIDKVRVATAIGGGSEVTYITKTGKEIKSS